MTYEELKAAGEKYLLTDVGKAIVKAVREDKIVGRGTCSAIDECMTDAELLSDIIEHNESCDEYKGYGKKVNTPKQAVAHFRWIHRLQRERQSEIESTAW